ncbi:uncharacterized protein LOC106180432 [Lingula anatina]|uniref:Uncharacterized protein LOC106180432 n=1 Tax=Lingula anatina TaxID=7574 RepID=A0A1S3KB52_LINAN|nr:uncharacterized protein LOC106180432 [Lingula anatina]|eukprot:XP_013419868.1 uncharacterized protein LOC106180432 [Lingula anatina]
MGGGEVTRAGFTMICALLSICSFSHCGALASLYRDMKVLVGEEMLLECHSNLSNINSVDWYVNHSSTQTPIASWNPGGQPEVYVPLNKMRDKLVTPSGDLSIAEVDRYHAGVYTCIVIGENGVEWKIQYNVVLVFKGSTTLESAFQDVTGSTPNPKVQGLTSPATPSVGTSLFASFKIIFCLIWSGLGILYLASN